MFALRLFDSAAAYCAAIRLASALKIEPVFPGMMHAQDQNILGIIDFIDDQMRLAGIGTDRRADFLPQPGGSGVFGKELATTQQFTVINDRLFSPEGNRTLKCYRDNIMVSGFGKPVCH
jgi:hypothetical protein